MEEVTCFALVDTDACLVVVVVDKAVVNVVEVITVVEAVCVTVDGAATVDEAVTLVERVTVDGAIILYSSRK